MTVCAHRSRHWFVYHMMSTASNNHRNLDSKEARDSGQVPQQHSHAKMAKFVHSDPLVVKMYHDPKGWTRSVWFSHVYDCLCLCFLTYIESYTLGAWLVEGWITGVELFILAWGCWEWSATSVGHPHSDESNESCMRFQERCRKSWKTWKNSSKQPKMLGVSYNSVFELLLSSSSSSSSSSFVDLRTVAMPEVRSWNWQTTRSWESWKWSSVQLSWLPREGPGGFCGDCMPQVSPRD